MILLLLLLLLPPLSAAGARDYFPPPDGAGGWRTLNNPAQILKVAGMDVGRLDQAFEYTQRTTQHGGLLVVRHGWLVYEKYFGRGNREANPSMMSVAKAYLSIACGQGSSHVDGSAGIAVRSTDNLRFGYLLLRKGRWGGQQIVPAEYVEQCGRPTPYNPHAPFSLQFDVNADGHVAGAPRDAFYKAGAGGFGIYVVPSHDMVIYKMAGSDSHYDPTATGLPELYKYDGSRDKWQPHPLDQFYEGPHDSDTGVKRLLEMVAAAAVR
jgi:CubicO group peptidase (beta-lactamase class C family)